MMTVGVGTVSDDPQRRALDAALVDVTTPETETIKARRRAVLAAAVAGLVLLPAFWLTQSIAGLVPEDGSREAYVAFYVDNLSRIPLRVTLLIGLWVIVLVQLVAVVRSACSRLDLAAILAITLAGAATAVYVGAEGVLLWPVLANADTTAATLSDTLDPGNAAAAVLSRDGLHAPASVLLGVAVLIIAWLLARSDLWGHWAMSALAVVAGAFAVSSVLVGPDGLGPGLVFVMWAPVVSVLLLIGRHRTRP
jgi:hypothetical protein